MRLIVCALFCWAASAQITSTVQTTVNFNFKGIVSAVQNQDRANASTPGSVVDVPGGGGTGGTFPLKSDTVAYRENFYRVDFEGYRVYEDRNTAATRPTVIIYPDFMNIEEETREKARQLAQRGYIAYVVDIYGKGKLFSRDTREQITAAWGMGQELKKEDGGSRYKAYLPLMFDQVVRNDSRVDQTRIVAIGFGLGGQMALDLVRTGRSDLLAGVTVSPHTLRKEFQFGAAVYASAVYNFLGFNDPNTPPANVTDLAVELVRATVLDYQFSSYGSTSGCFHDSRASMLTSNAPDLFKVTECFYSTKADRRYWKTLLDLLSEKFSF